MLKCGMSEAVITPPIGSSIPGGFEPFYALAVDDELYVKICYFTDGEHSVLMAVADHVEVERAVALPIRRAIAEKLRLPLEAVLFECTHNHSGGPVLYLPLVAEPDRAYVEWMTQRTVEAACKAVERAVPCAIGAAVGSVDNVSFSRRYRMRDGSVKTWPGFDNPDKLEPESEIDPAVTVIRIDRLDGSPIGMITNFSCHATAHTAQAFSADYPAGISAAVKSALGDDAVSLFINGACADVTHIDWDQSVFTKEDLGDRDHYLRIGRMIGCEALKTRELCRVSDCAAVGFSCETTEIVPRVPTEAEYRAAMEYIDSHPDLSLAPCDGYYALSTKLLYERREERRDTEVQVFTLGNIALAFFPMEMFAAAGMDCKARSRATTTVIGSIANDALGYVPTVEALEHGGYESTLGWTSCCAAGTSEALVDSALRQIDRLIPAPQQVIGSAHACHAVRMFDTELLDAVTDELRAQFGEAVCGVDTDSLQEAVVRALSEKRLTLATAESCTGGLVSKRITEVSGSSAVFHCGVCSYANEIKEKLLGVRHETLERFGAVSEQTAAEMAAGVRALSGADIAVSTTGLAGPGGGSAEKPVGLVYVGVSSKNFTTVRRLLLGHGGGDERESIRSAAASNALFLALQAARLADDPLL